MVQLASITEIPKLDPSVAIFDVVENKTAKFENVLLFTSSWEMPVNV